MLRAATLSAPAPATDADTPDVIARIEAWVAGYLDGTDGPKGFGSFHDWQTHAVELFKARDRGPKVRDPKAEAAAGWRRVSLSRKHGASVVRLLDQTLVKETDIQEFADELMDLIAAGHRRIALDFGHVERLSCAVLPALAEASRLCAEGGLGGLRMFNFRPEVAPVVGLCPLTRGLAVPADEAAAVDGEWPGRDVPRPLPEALLASFLTPRIAAARPSNAEDCPAMPDAPETSPRPAPAYAFALVVQSGANRGRAVPIGDRGLLIGREPGCQIRSDHAFLSRRHAIVRAAGGRAFLRDLGSTNGTLHNGREVGRDEIELQPGDRLQIGPLKFAVHLDPRNSSKAPDEDEIAHWLGRDGDEEDAAAAGEDTAYDVPSPASPLRMQVIEDVLVITPLDPQLLGGPDVSAFRDELSALLEAPAPHRVVVNLKLSARLSNAAVGVLVAHHIRLDRLGGALRLAEPHVRVAEVLNQMRLPLILDVYPSEDEAVVASWGR